MKKTVSLILLVVLALSLTLPTMAGGEIGQGVAYAPVLSSLTHNCPNTGIMLPERFHPDTTSYILTVASWVSRVSFTPTSADPNATIYINGSPIRSGSTSSYFKMTDKPQTVTIKVSNSYGDSTSYTIFLQRRPSDKRTRVSAGYISEIYQKNNHWYIGADLVTVKYGEGNMSTFTNTDSHVYKYPITKTCIFYYGDFRNPTRAVDIGDFYNNYRNTGNTLYRLVYIEDEIVAVMPYEADY